MFESFKNRINKAGPVIRSVVTAEIIFIIIFSFFIGNCFVPTESMAPTINGGDCILVNRLAYKNEEPKRYDAIVFKSPDKENGKTVWLTKRIIGIPGDTIEIKDGITYINNQKITENYVNTQTGSYGPFYVPKAGDEVEYNSSTDEASINNIVVGNKSFLDKYCKKTNEKYYVSENCYFCLGDNRNNSYDSRFWENKYTVESEMMGKLMLNISQMTYDFQ